MKVDVYYNLHRHCLSVRSKGRVIYHSMGVELKNVSFVVGQKGRERVLRNKRKNVHAVVRGELINFESKSTDGLQRVTYNPYKNSSFVLAATGEPIYSSLSALIVGKQIYTK